MVSLGLFLVLTAAIGQTALAFALFGYSLGFVLLGFGVAVMIAALAFSPPEGISRLARRMRIAPGIVLIIVAPLVWFLLILFPIKGFFILTYIPPVAIALYGIFILIVGLVDRRREEAG
ncbi:MAG: hypothetical protein LN412_03115 [Candidatus Thermoplasmatota archaeon]|nr:hypothetical protein [Candidatus Thermoplasmatota archaeon]